MATFYDRNDPKAQMNGREIHDAEQLLDLFRSYRKGAPVLCELMGDAGYKLLIGIGRDVGCVQYSPIDGSPPYLMATGDNGARSNSFREFCIDGAPTQIPERHCLPMIVVEEIAIEFLASGKRSKSVNWEEI